MASPRNQNTRALVRHVGPDTLEPRPVKEMEPSEHPESYYREEPCAWPDSAVLISQGNHSPALDQVPTHAYLSEPMSDFDEDEDEDEDEKEEEEDILPVVTPALEPGAEEGNSMWCVEVIGPQRLPWFESIASIKMFAEAYPEITQVCALAEGTFLIRTNLDPKEEAYPRLLAILLRHCLRGVKMISPSSYYKTDTQILWTRPLDMF